MTDNEDAYIYYYDEGLVKIDLSTVKKTAEGVRSDLGFSLRQTWESCLSCLNFLAQVYI